MGVGGTDHPEFERVHPELLLQLQAPTQSGAAVLVGEHLGRGRHNPAEIGVVDDVEVGELIFRGQQRMGFTRAFGLRHLHQRLEAMAHAGVIGIDRLAGFLVARQEHRAARKVAVMRNSEHPPTGVLLIEIHEGPEILHILGIEIGERQDLICECLVVPEDDNPVDIASAGLARPLVANQCCEFAGIVVTLRRLGVLFPDIAHEGLVRDLRFRPLGHLLHQQIKGFTTLAGLEHLVELLAQRRLEQFRVGISQTLSEAQVFGMIRHHKKIERSLQSSLLTGIAGDRFTSGKAIGLVESQFRSRQTGVRRQRSVEVGVTEVSAVATGALSTLDHRRCRLLGFEQGCGSTGAGSKPRGQSNDAGEGQSRNTGLHHRFS
ncbi:MAG: Uncharacterised protein [Cyanobium sp. ARS6]|nr:MAG: Uncharacterised protein [Cyanobium sp. ARS6]